jgi:hypothetical protein
MIKKNSFGSGTSRSQQTALEAEQHLAEGQLLFEGHTLNKAVSDVPCRNLKISSFQNGRTKFRTKANLKKGTMHRGFFNNHINNNYYYNNNNNKSRSRDSSVGIATVSGLDGRGSIPERGKRFCLLRVVQTGSEAYPVSYPMGTWGSFPGGKAVGE